MNAKTTPPLRLFVAGICAAVLAATSGCASPSSVTRRSVGPEDEGEIQQAFVRVESTPYGARVLVDGMFVGTAPTTVPVDVDVDGLILTDVTIGAEFHNPNETGSIGDPSPEEIERELYSGSVAPGALYFTVNGVSVRSR